MHSEFVELAEPYYPDNNENEINNERIKYFDIFFKSNEENDCSLKSTLTSSNEHTGSEKIETRGAKRTLSNEGRGDGTFHVERTFSSITETLEDSSFEFLKQNNDGFPLDLHFDSFKEFFEWSEDQNIREQALTTSCIATGISTLDMIPMTYSFGLTKLQLSRKGLLDISALQSYHYLRNIDLSYNYLKDISPLNGLPFLSELNVSHNEISNIDCLKPPWFLSYINLSYNAFTIMPDFTRFWSLKYINLSHNYVEIIEGLQDLRYLKNLDLSFNKIELISNLSKLPLKELNVSNNAIDQWEFSDIAGVHTLHCLEELNASHNKIISLDIFQNAYTLMNLNLEHNNIENISDVEYLDTMRNLKNLNLERNSICEVSHFKEIIIDHLPKIEILNNTVLMPREKAKAKLLQGNSIMLDAMKKYDERYLNLLLVGPREEPLARMATDPYILILVDVLGASPSSWNISLSSGRRSSPLVRSPKIFTTFPLEKSDLPDLENYYSYVPTDEFNDLSRKGKFVATECTLGYKYGISYEDIQFDGKIILIQLKLETALQFLWQGLRSVLILAMPYDAKNHSALFREHFFEILDISYEGISKGERNPEEEDIKHLKSTGCSPIVNRSVEYFHECDKISTLKPKKLGSLSLVNLFSESTMDHRLPLVDYENSSIGSQNKEGRYEEKHSCSEILNAEEIQDDLVSTSWICRSEESESEAMAESVKRELEEESDLEICRLSQVFENIVLADEFVKEFLEKRNQYIEIHLNYPGIFSISVDTGDCESGWGKVCPIVEEMAEALGREEIGRRGAEEDAPSPIPEALVLERAQAMMQRLSALEFTSTEQLFKTTIGNY